MNVRRCWCCSARQTIDRPSKPTSFRGRQRKKAEKKRRKQQQFFSSSFSSSSSNIATLQLQHRTKQTGRQLERERRKGAKQTLAAAAAPFQFGPPVSLLITSIFANTHTCTLFLSLSRLSLSFGGKDEGKWRERRGKRE